MQSGMPFERAAATPPAASVSGDVQCGGLGMGQSGVLPASGNVTIRADYAAESTISRVEVIRNNQVVHSEAPGDWKGRLEWTDTAVGKTELIRDFSTGKPTVFYYVRITAEADARAWSSPCWFNPGWH